MPHWISHRGIDKIVAENSLESFKLAVEGGYESLETDLRTTVDGAIILAHDDDLTRVANQSLKVSKSTYAEVSSVRLADGQNVLSFEQFVEIFAGQSWVFDIKPETGESTIRQLYNWATKRHSIDWLSDQARFLFWSKKQERFFKRLFPRGQCMARKSQCYRAGVSSLSGLSALGKIESGVTYSLPPRFLGMNLYSKKIVEKYHKRGAKLLAFLPSTENQIDQAIEAGFDEILFDSEIPKKYSSSLRSEN